MGRKRWPHTSSNRPRRLLVSEVFRIKTHSRRQPRSISNKNTFQTATFIVDTFWVADRSPTPTSRGKGSDSFANDFWTAPQPSSTLCWRAELESRGQQSLTQEPSLTQPIGNEEHFQAPMPIEPYRARSLKQRAHAIMFNRRWCLTVHVVSQRAGGLGGRPSPDRGMGEGWGESAPRPRGRGEWIG